MVQQDQLVSLAPPIEPLPIAQAGANGAPGLNGAAGRTGRLYCIQVEWIM